MAYYVGDAPAQPVAVEPARNSEPIDLTPFTGATAVLRSPSGVPVVPALDADLDGDLVTVDYSEGFTFDEAGLWVLTITLENVDDETHEQLAPVRIVVQTDDGWMTVDEAQAVWSDAASLTDWELWELLEIAKHEVLDYAPTLAVGAPVPLGWKQAARLHARDGLMAGAVNRATGEQGDGSFALTTWPMDWKVKQMIRPKRGMPAVG